MKQLTGASYFGKTLDAGDTWGKTSGKTSHQSVNLLFRGLLSGGKSSGKGKDGHGKAED